MPVFDFKHTSDEKKVQECTYTTFRSNETEATAEKPMLVLDNSNRKWKHHSCGIFTNPIKKTSFEFDEEDGTVSADILHLYLKDIAAAFQQKFAPTNSKQE